MQPFIYGVQCNGQESELLNCSKSGVMKVSCESVAGIVCQGIHNSQRNHHLPLELSWLLWCMFLFAHFLVLICV